MWLDLALVGYRHDRRRESVDSVSEFAEERAIVAALSQERMSGEIWTQAIYPGGTGLSRRRAWKGVVVGVERGVHETSF
jgi:hypothetical protein